MTQWIRRLICAQRNEVAPPENWWATTCDIFISNPHKGKEKIRIKGEMEQLFSLILFEGLFVENLTPLAALNIRRPACPYLNMHGSQEQLTSRNSSYLSITIQNGPGW